ncbi:MAG TPA: hypothetical protein VEZ72_00330 [Paenibacillus sp.]|nr:hypothetical protein [Paenibacillus sp.]
MPDKSRYTASATRNGSGPAARRLGGPKRVRARGAVGCGDPERVVAGGAAALGPEAGQGARRGGLR